MLWYIMKKIIFLVVMVSILSGFLIGAKALKETVSSTPVITLTFSEDSKITKAVLSQGNRTYNFTFEPLQGEFAIVHKITLMQALMNGNYTLYVEAQDRVENAINTTQIIELDIPYIPITLVNPPLGVSPTPVFNLTIATPENNADCRYSTSSISSYERAVYFFEDITPRMHTKLDFNSNETLLVATPQTEKQIYVFCRSEDGRINPTIFNLSYDLTPPTIGASADPRVVVDISEEGKIKAQIKVNSNDKVVCRYSGVVNQSEAKYVPAQGRFQDMPNYFGTAEDESNMSKYTTTPATTVDLTGYISDKTKQYNFTFNVSCMNRATFNVNDYTNRMSNTVSVDITVSLLSQIILTKKSPPDYLSSTSVFLNFTTNKRSTCTYAVNNETAAELETSDNLVHTKNYGTMAEGRNIVKVECNAEGGASVSREFPVVIDTTPPLRPIIISPNATCMKSLTASFFSNDSESGIGGYNYTAEGPAVSVNGSASGENPSVTVSKDAKGAELNLTPSATYIFRARAINNAGLISDEGTGNLIVYDETGVLCDRTPPTVFLKQNATSSGTYVTLVCIDSGGTRCDNTSYSYFMAETSNCTAGTPAPIEYDAARQSYTALVTTPGYFCYEAKDIAGNIAKGSEKVTVLSSDYCRDNAKDYEETDVDCGGAGICPRCLFGKSCSVNSDCATLFCDKATNTCQEPSCSDGLENGYETDVDCGGLDCSKCPLSKKCSIDSDCITNYCMPDKTCGVASCNDSYKNGFETDVDCGGNCSKCAIGKSCLVDSDCVSGKCFSYECIQPPVGGEEQQPLVPSEAGKANLGLIIKILVLILGVLCSSGGYFYIYYKKHILKKPAPKEAARQAAPSAPAEAGKPLARPRVLTPAERLKLLAQREKEQIQKGLERERVFSVFGKPKPLQKPAQKPAEKPAPKPAEKAVVGRILEAIKAKPSEPAPRQAQKKEAFERLGEIGGKKEEAFEKLEKLKKEGAFEKLEKLKQKNKK